MAATSSLPVWSYEHDDQRLQALARANEVRSSGRLFKEQIGGLKKRDAWLVAARVLRHAPHRVARMPIHEFLEALPLFGPVRVRRTLMGGHRRWVWPLTPVGELTTGQCLMVAETLEGLAKRW